MEPRPGDTVELLRDDPNFPCAYKGQRGRIWRVLPEGLYVELRCGHPVVIANGRLGDIRVLPRTEERERESEMKQAVIANNKGVLPVSGYSEQVKRFKTNLQFSEQLDEQISADKDLFRDLAGKAVDMAEGEVRVVEFLADDGSAVPVTMPDIDKAGNRVELTSALAKEVLQLGVNVDDLQVTETSTTFTLQGDFVEWFRKVLQDNYTSKGLPIPDGCKEKTVTRLSEAGARKLQAMSKEAKTENERAAARLLLKKGCKAPQVTAK